MALANILRTDAEAHRPLPADSELVQAIAVLARAQQDAVWNRGQLSNQLRSHLKQYFPAAEQLRQLPLVEQAMGRQTQALVGQLDAACRDELAAATARHSRAIPTPRS